MPRKIIVNTSPLFYLHRLRCLDIFQKLYGEITVPEAVATELNIGRKTGEDVPQLGKYRWIKIEKVSVPRFIEKYRWIPASLLAGGKRYFSMKNF